MVQLWVEAQRGPPPLPSTPSPAWPGGPRLDFFWLFLRGPASLPAEGGVEGIRQACEAGEGNPVKSWGSAKAR